MVETPESLRTDLDELERRVNALAESVGHIIKALDQKSQGAKKLDFSHIEGHQEHTPQKLDFSHIPGHIEHSR